MLSSVAQGGKKLSVFLSGQKKKEEKGRTNVSQIDSEHSKEARLVKNQKKEEGWSKATRKARKKEKVEKGKTIAADEKSTLHQREKERKRSSYTSSRDKKADTSRVPFTEREKGEKGGQEDKSKKNRRPTARHHSSQTDSHKKKKSFVRNSGGAASSTLSAKGEREREGRARGVAVPCLLTKRRKKSRSEDIPEKKGNVLPADLSRSKKRGGGRPSELTHIASVHNPEDQAQAEKTRNADPTARGKENLFTTSSSSKEEKKGERDSKHLGESHRHSVRTEMGLSGRSKGGEMHDKGSPQRRELEDCVSVACHGERREKEEKTHRRGTHEVLDAF